MHEVRHSVLAAFVTLAAQLCHMQFVIQCAPESPEPLVSWPLMEATAGQG